MCVILSSFQGDGEYIQAEPFLDRSECMNEQVMGNGSHDEMDVVIELARLLPMWCGGYLHMARLF
jgi:hypothetical protein